MYVTVVRVCTQLLASVPGLPVRVSIKRMRKHSKLANFECFRMRLIETRTGRPGTEATQLLYMYVHVAYTVLSHPLSLPLSPFLSLPFSPFLSLPLSPSLSPFLSLSHSSAVHTFSSRAEHLLQQVWGQRSVHAEAGPAGQPLSRQTQSLQRQDDR